MMMVVDADTQCLVVARINTLQLRVEQLRTYHFSYIFILFEDLILMDVNVGPLCMDVVLMESLLLLVLMMKVVLGTVKEMNVVKMAEHQEHWQIFQHLVKLVHVDVLDLCMVVVMMESIQPRLPGSRAVIMVLEKSV